LNAFPLSAQIIALVVLLLGSAFFSIAETSMMALNRYRLKALQAQGRHGAQQAAALLARTDRLLSVILIGNNLLNAGLSALVTAMAISYFGNHEKVVAIATGLVAFAIIVFAEITPKVIGANYPERIALPISIILKPLLTVAYPLVWFVNLFVRMILWVLRIKTEAANETQRMSPEELRVLVLESAHYIPQKHRSILINLFDLERIRVDDVMTPRAHIEAIDLSADLEVIGRQLATSHHTRLAVYEGDINNVKGVLHIRRAVSMLLEGSWTRETVTDLLVEPYFIPGATPVFQQLQYFQERRQRLALVVDEYGEVQGLVTLEDILEEMIGEFTTEAPGKSGARYVWGSDGTVLVEGGALLRDLNRRLGLRFPLEGPKTLNGLILDHLQDIPESGISLKIADCAMQVLHTEDRVVRTVRLMQPRVPPVPKPAYPG
jgi:Mg2+/Co2+ transporter CorB